MHADWGILKTRKCQVQKWLTSVNTCVYIHIYVCSGVFQVYMTGNYDTSNAALTTMLQRHKAGIDYFVCSNVPNNPIHNVKTSPR